MVRIQAETSGATNNPGNLLEARDSNVADRAAYERGGRKLEEQGNNAELVGRESTVTDDITRPLLKVFQSCMLVDQPGVRRAYFRVLPAALHDRC
jgi:hypothetical protein